MQKKNEDIYSILVANRYKKQGQNPSAVDRTINGFLAFSYLWGGIILALFVFGIIYDSTHGFPFLGDFALPIPFLVIWQTPNYVLKMKINKMEPATTEWVPSWRF